MHGISYYLVVLGLKPFYFLIFFFMKKMFSVLIGLAMMLPMASQALAADPKLPALEARAAAVGAPSYAEWCSEGNVFWAGYEGFVDFMDNYVTEETRAKVIAAKAYSPSKLTTVMPGTTQSVTEWLKVNPWK